MNWHANKLGSIGLLVALILGVVLFTNISAKNPESPENLPGFTEHELRASNVITSRVFLPIVQRASISCPALVTETYGTVSPYPGTSDGRPAESHPDLNLAVRGYVATTAGLGLVNYDGDHDPNAPQLAGLFTDNRTATFRSAYRVYDWDWLGCNCRGNLLDRWQVTLAGLSVTPTEIIQMPGWGLNIGYAPTNYAAMVLYADTTRLTVVFTRADRIVDPNANNHGYALHLENICVEPRLLMLYRSLNASGRGQLPALNARQGIGTAIGNELGVAIRDSGEFMDPRSRYDWWQGR